MLNQLKYFVLTHGLIAEDVCTVHVHEQDHDGQAKEKDTVVPESGSIFGRRISFKGRDAEQPAGTSSGPSILITDTGADLSRSRSSSMKSSPHTASHLG